MSRRYVSYSISLLCLQPIRSKDFASEVRAFMDVEQFISQAQLILDLPETNLADIIDHMLSFMVIKGNTSWTESEAKQELFTHDSGSMTRSSFSTLSVYRETDL